MTSDDDSIPIHHVEIAATSENRFNWRFTTPLFLGSVLNPINSSVIATSLVPIALAIRVSVGRTAVLVSVLYLASSIFQPTWGKVAEQLGPRRVFLLGIHIVMAGGLVGGFGNDLTTLVVARILLGVGTSASYPCAMLIIRRRALDVGLSAPPGGVLGGLQVAGLSSAAIGFPLGGILVGAWGWRATFFLNVPIALVTLALAFLWAPKDVPYKGSRKLGDLFVVLDVVGIVGFAGTMTSLLVFLLSLPQPAWIALCAALGFGTALVLWELRARLPFIDVRLLRSNLALTRTYLRMALTIMCVYTVWYGLTQWIQAGRSISAQEAGLLLLPMAVVAAVVVRPISRRNMVRGPLIIAAGCSLVASIGILFIDGRTPIVWIIFITLMFGVTMGTTASGNQTALYLQVPHNQIGTASGLLRTFTYVGSIASSTVISIVFHSKIDDDHLHVIAVIMIITSALALFMTLADRDLSNPDGLLSDEVSADPPY